MKAKKSKGADSGTQYRHWTKNPHEFEDKKEAEKIHNEQVRRVIKTKKIKLSGGTVNVYKAEFSEIDLLIEELKKAVRKHGVNDYACNNIRNFLEEALKKVRLSEN